MTAPICRTEAHCGVFRKIFWPEPSHQGATRPSEDLHFKTPVWLSSPDMPLNSREAAVGMRRSGHGADNLYHVPAGTCSGGKW